MTERLVKQGFRQWGNAGEISPDPQDNVVWQGKAFGNGGTLPAITLQKR